MPPRRPQRKQLYTPFWPLILSECVPSSPWRRQRAIAASPPERVTSLISDTMSAASRTSDAALDPMLLLHFSLRVPLASTPLCHPTPKTRSRILPDPVALNRDRSRIRFGIPQASPWPYRNKSKRSQRVTEEPRNRELPSPALSDGTPARPAGETSTMSLQTIRKGTEEAVIEGSQIGIRSRRNAGTRRSRPRGRISQVGAGPK